MNENTGWQQADDEHLEAIGSTLNPDDPAIWQTHARIYRFLGL